MRCLVGVVKFVLFVVCVVLVACCCLCYVVCFGVVCGCCLLFVVCYVSC